MDEGGDVAPLAQRGHGRSRASMSPSTMMYGDLPTIFARARGDVDPDDEEHVDVSTLALPPAAAPPPLPVALLARLLRAYATLGFNSPTLFGAAARFLGLVSASSGSDSGGSAGFRPLGTHAADRITATPGVTPRRLIHLPDGQNADGDVAVVSMSTFKDLVTFASAYARARYVDEDDTPRMWAALLASATAHVTQAASATQSPHVLDVAPRFPARRNSIAGPRLGVYPVSPDDVAHLLHACADASIPAVALARASLEHLRVHLRGYSVAAAARLLWAAALQGVYEPRVAADAFEEICGRAASASSDAASAGAKSWLDDFPAELLLKHHAEGDRGLVLVPASVRIAQSQLYMAWLGLSLEGGSAADAEAMAAALNAVPAALLTAWRSSYARAEAVAHNHRSILHAEVSRLLAVAGIPHACEVLLPEGLSVDVTIPIEHAVASAAPVRPLRVTADSRDRRPAAPSAAGMLPAPRKPVIVIEVNGPSHYAPAVQGMGGAAAADAAAALAAPLARPATAKSTMWPGDTRLAPHELTSLGAAADDAEAGGGGDAAVPKPVPSLRTRTRSRWLAAAGYETVTLDWAELRAHPSTEERLELLADKGVSVPRHLRSY